MFVVKIWSGLGNQMFGYAFLKQLEKQYPENRITGYIARPRSGKYHFLNYCLDEVFDIHIKESDWKTVALLSDVYPESGPACAVLRPLSRVVNCACGHKSTYIHQDNYTRFYPEIYHLSTLKSYYFEGVWANSEYLAGIEDILMRDFEFKGDLSEKNREYMRKIASSCSVGIHIRRGDYVTLGYLLPTGDYYMKAIEVIKKKVKDPKFFVFSNDHAYCRQLFEGKIDYEIIEGNNGKDSFRDMQLMSNCKHNIIANSTFSFWGAYLNKNPNKIVIAPNIGVAEGDVPFACPEWIKIDV